MPEREAQPRQRPRWTDWAFVRLACYAAAIAATAIVATLLTRLLVPPAPDPWHGLVWIKNLLLPVALFALYALLVRRIEHRPAREIDPRNAPPAILLGCLIGFAVIAGCVLLLWALGFADIAEGTGLAGLAPALLVPLVVAMGEELLFRVILFGTLEKVFGSLAALLVSSALFGLAHAGNPGATPFAIAALSIDLGLLLALAYIVTRNIWFPVAIHFAWNFAEGFIFGVYNSGTRDPHTWLRTTLTGPDLLTGGGFGPEGSAVTLAIGIAVSAILYRRIRRDRLWQPARVQWR